MQLAILESEDKSTGAMENLGVLTHDYFNWREGIYPLALGTDGQVLKTRVLIY